MLVSVHSFPPMLRGTGGVRTVGFYDGVPSVASGTAVGVEREIVASRAVNAELSRQSHRVPSITYAHAAGSGHRRWFGASEWLVCEQYASSTESVVQHMSVTKVTLCGDSD